MFFKFRQTLSSIANETQALCMHFIQCVFCKILARACGMITLPLLTFYFTAEEMGIYQLLVGSLGIFVELATLGTRQFFSVEYCRFSTLYARLLLIVKNLWLTINFTSVLFLIVMIFSISKFSVYWLVFIFAFSQYYFSIFNEIYFSFLNLEMKFFRYNILLFFLAFIQMLMTILSLKVFHFKLTGFVFGLLFSDLLFLIYILVSLRKYLSSIKRLAKINKVRLHSVFALLKKTLPFLPPALSFWLLVNIDQWMLGAISGVDDVGIYAFAGKFSLFFDYIVSSTFILVYTPRLYHKLREEYHQACDRNTIYALVVVAMSFIFYQLVVILLPICRYFISENFYESLNYIPLLILAATLRLATHLLQLVIKYQRFVGFVFWSNIVCALLNAGLNYYWIPEFRIMGCVYATVVSFAAMFLANLFFYQYMIRSVRKEKEMQYAA